MNVNEPILVKNKGGTAENPKSQEGDYWITFWEKESGRVATSCLIVYGCKSPTTGGRKAVADGGGHVYIDGESAKEYIIPMCNKCNGQEKGTPFLVYKRDLVPVTDS